MTGPRVLTLDIETAPSLAYVWRLFDENVSLPQLVEPSEVICFAAKWLDAPKVEFRSTFHDGKDVMVQRAHDLLSDADCLVTFNGRAFDVKHLRREFLLAGLDPPAPHLDIDLLPVVRKNFKFASSKLQHVATELGLGAKESHQGFQLWRDAIAGSDDEKRKAWRIMRRYNLQDVRLTEALYLRLLPWINGHPNPALFDPELEGQAGVSCPKCGGANLNRRGWAVTATSRYRRTQCQDCGAWGRDTKRDAYATTRGA